MDVHMPNILAVLEEQDDLFHAYYARYRTTLEARRAAAAPKLADTSSAAAGLPAGLARASSSGGGASTNLVGLLQDAKRVIEPERARIVEDTGDTRVMRVPLIPSREVPMWDSGGGSPFVALLKAFTPNPAEPVPGGGAGNNALFVRGEFVAAAGYDRLYGAVNILGDRTGGGGSTVLAHMGYRVDPARDGSLRRLYVQGHKLGFWQTSSKTFVAEASAPIVPGREFWWRLVAHPNGFASYVDGQLVHVSVPPPGHQLTAGQELYVSLPITGDAGEKATWRVKQVWWGSLPHDPAAARLLDTMAGASGSMVANQVRATGVPAGATEAEVRAAWALTPYQPSQVVLSEAGAAVMTFPSEEQVRRILANPASLRVTVRGAALTLSHVIARAGGGVAGGAGAPGGAARPAGGANQGYR